MSGEQVYYHGRMSLIAAIFAVVCGLAGMAFAPAYFIALWWGMVASYHSARALTRL